MYRKKFRVTLVSISVFSVYAVFSFIYAGGPGTTGGQFLKLGGDARAMGLGEAFAAISDDVNAVYWNPAGLSQGSRETGEGRREMGNVKREVEDKKEGTASRQMSLTHMNMLVGTRYLNFAYTQHVTRTAAIGIDWFNLYGEDNLYDGSGNKTGSYINLNSYLTLAYSQRVTKHLFTGISVKTIYTQLAESYRTSNVSFDLSSLYHLTDKLTFGMNLQNLDTGMKFTADPETIPLNLKLGTAYRMFDDNLTLAVDFNTWLDSIPSINTGFEYWWKIIALRGGYRYRVQNNQLGDITVFTAGLGLRIKTYQLDYAFVPYGDLGNNTHFISLSSKF